MHIILRDNYYSGVGGQAAKATQFKEEAKVLIQSEMISRIISGSRLFVL